MKGCQGKRARSSARLGNCWQERIMMAFVMRGSDEMADYVEILRKQSRFYEAQLARTILPRLPILITPSVRV